MSTSDGGQDVAIEADGPPPKKMRLEHPQPQPSNPGTPIDDLDDLYGTPSHANTPLRMTELSVPEIGADARPEQPLDAGVPSAIPGLGLLPEATSDTTTTFANEVKNGNNSEHMPILDSEERDEGVQNWSEENVLVDEEHNLNPENHPASLTAPTVVASTYNHNGYQDDLIRPSIEDEDPEISTKLNGHTAGTHDLEPGQEPEWETDSSASDSSDSGMSPDPEADEDEDQEEEEEDAEDYELLGPEEQARMLMQGDGGSDDEGETTRSGKAGTAASIKTKNEMVDAKVEKPDVVITTGMKMEELGTVASLVDSIVVVKANVSGEYRVLEYGSVLCLEDRTVVGEVAETLGRVQQPYYSVRFNSPTEIAETGLSVGTKIFYVEQYSHYVFTQALKAFKGSDASNIHDEEVGEDELEFSDDEAEAEHRRRVKQERQGKRGGRPGHQFPAQRPSYSVPSSQSLSYDDAPAGQGIQADGDGEPYTPLARPANFQELMSQGNTVEEATFRNGVNRGHRPGRGRDRGRGRDGRGGRGSRGRGGFIDRSSQPYGQSGAPMQTSPPSYSGAPSSMHNDRSSNPASSMAASYSHPQSQPHPQPQQHALPLPPTPLMQASFQQPYPAMPYGWFQSSPQPPMDLAFLPPQAPPQQPPMPMTPFAAPSPVNPTGSVLPAGAFVNPAFFRHPQSTPMRNQRSPPVTPSGFGASPTLSVDPDAAFRAAQEKLDILRGLGRPGSGSP